MTPFESVSHARAPLVRSARAIAAGELRVGFLGGSITAPQTGTRWPEPFAGWLTDRFPNLRVTIENAALGATGSDLGVFRARPEIIDRGCDLVFVEYAVNDYHVPTAQRNRSREGLLRQLLAAGCDVVLVYTFCPEMLPDMAASRVPPSIAEFETLAEAYGISSVWMGLHAWREVCQGRMRWDEWLPDGLHPETRGSLSYAQSVIAFCDSAWTSLSPDFSVSAFQHFSVSVGPVCSAAWDNPALLDLSVPEREGPWALRRWHGCPGMTQALHSTAPSARLTFAFEGRGLLLGFDFGRLAGEIRYRVDNGEWHVTDRDRPAWAGDRGWYRPVLVSDDLEPGRHTFELETLAVPVANGTGGITTLGLIGVLR